MGSIITLLTDFGTRDGYVGQMKGVMLGINPHAQLVDIAHDLTPFSILEASLVLESAAQHFPDSTIHLVVVDPGVGGERRAIAARCGGQFFVCPDNGLLWPYLSEKGSWEIRDFAGCRFIGRSPQPTFHGRDIFALVAAHLSIGFEFNKLGQLIDDPVKMEIPVPKTRPWGLEGEIIHIDAFGNAMTNIELDSLNRNISRINVGGLYLTGVKNYYSEVDEGAPLALINSFGRLEIGINQGRADEALNLYKGAEVSVQWD